MKNRLIVLSVDALFYEDMEYMRKLPYFKEMKPQSSYAKGGMRSIYPSLTYPAHCTMITGAYPDKTGVFQNEVLDVNNPRPDWIWYRSDVKVGNVLTYAKKAGLTTACINWPTMAGDPDVDYLVPEIWGMKPDDDQYEIVAKYSSEKAIPILKKHFHKWDHGNQPQHDFFMTDVAVDIIKQGKPDVLFIHLTQLDHDRHVTGLYSHAVDQALDIAAENFGRLVEATKDAGIYDETNFVVLGDHGQISVNKMLNPNIIFTQNGLIDIDEEGKVLDWKVWAMSAALSCQIILKDPDDAETRAKVEDILYDICKNEELGVESVLTAEECERDYHLTGNFQYVLEGRNTCFRSACTGELVVGPDNTDYKFSIASHGHLPHKGAQPAFMCYGPAFRKGYTFSRREMVDQAPTYAKVLGIDLPEAHGTPILDILV
ncbi:MAG: alkaline phosphatase family protein [Oscillospiraceae bacterium]|nr:alkaline phosphatase family protein [Oscillospiraceae bacterium]